MSEVDPDKMWKVLSNERRRLVINLLDGYDQIRLSDFSEVVAREELGQEPKNSKKKQSVYVSLMQTHAEKLAEVDIIEFDGRAKKIKRGENWKVARRLLGVFNNILENEVR